MAFDDRLSSLLLGMGIGFVLGYLVRLVREMKEELDEVDEIVKTELGHDDDHNERGFMRVPWIANIAILLVVGLTAWASFVSQKSSNDVQDGQSRIAAVSDCNVEVMTKALDALNERSAYSKQQSDANVDLQTSFSKFFNLLLHQPPYNQKRRYFAAKAYQGNLNAFVKIAGKTKATVAENPFPTAEDLRACIEAKLIGEQ